MLEPREFPFDHPSTSSPRPAVAVISRPGDAHGWDMTIVADAMNSDPLFAATAVALAVKSGEERRQVIAGWGFWCDLTPQDRATVIDIFRRGLSAPEVARRSGASERSIYRWRQERGYDHASQPGPCRGFKDGTGHLETWDAEEDEDWQS
jgi:Homeodomain-like domain